MSRSSRVTVDGFWQGVRGLVTPSPADPAILRGALVIWLVTALIVVAVLMLLVVTGFSIVWLKLAALLVVFPAVGAVLLVFRLRTGLQAIPLWLETVVQAMLVTGFCILASFALASLATPYIDQHLIAADRLLGFDWLTHARFVHERPWLRSVLAYAYGTLSWQFPAALCVLAVFGAHRHLQVFLLAWILTLVLILPISGALPAKAAFGHYGLSPISDYPISRAVPGAFDLIEALRAGDKRQLLSYDFDGIVTFPSFHAAAGLLLAWGFWAVPWLRWPMLLLNLVMIASTPAIGAHYLVDVIAGQLLAMLSLRIAQRMLDANGID